jgi:hypothetical protein
MIKQTCRILKRPFIFGKPLLFAHSFLLLVPYQYNLFSTLCAAIALKLCTWLYIFDLQIKFVDGCYRPILGRVMPLELSHFMGFYSFPDFFSQCVQLLHLNFVHGFISMTYRSIWRWLLSTNFLEELCPLNLVILRDFTVYMLLDFTVFGTFFHNVYSYCI